MKFKCDFTGKIFETKLGTRTIVMCPLCNLPIEFTYGFIGLSDNIGVEIKDDAFHKIIKRGKE